MIPEPDCHIFVNSKLKSACRFATVRNGTMLNFNSPGPGRNLLQPTFFHTDGHLNNCFVCTTTKRGSRGCRAGPDRRGSKSSALGPND